MAPAQVEELQSERHLARGHPHEHRGSILVERSCTACSLREKVPLLDILAPKMRIKAKYEPVRSSQCLDGATSPGTTPENAGRRIQMPLHATTKGARREVKRNNSKDVDMVAAMGTPNATPAMTVEARRLPRRRARCELHEIN